MVIVRNAIDPNLNLIALLGSTNNIRLVTANSVTEKASWAAVTPFDGIFDGGKNKRDLLQMPMVMVTAGVKRFTGSDFMADVLPMAGGLQLSSLRPNASATASSLAAYSSSCPLPDLDDRAVSSGGVFGSRSTRTRGCCCASGAVRFRWPFGGLFPSNVREIEQDSWQR